MARGPSENDDDRRRALAELERLSRERDMFAGLFGAVRRAGRHFTGADAAGDDRIEVWGRRIGRGLGALALIGLAAYLYVTHLR